MQLRDVEYTGGVERDSPENPFLAGDEVAPGSPETPTPITEKPTILYVLYVSIQSPLTWATRN
jgi:hypothetical protein